MVKSQQLLCGMPLIIGLNSLNQMDPFFLPKILFCDHSDMKINGCPAQPCELES